MKTKKHLQGLCVVVIALTLCLSISANAFALSVSPTSITLGSTSGNTSQFSISATESWTISGKPTWLNLSSTSGTGVKIITVTANSATQNSARSVTLSIIPQNGTAQKVTITQSACTHSWSSLKVGRAATCTVDGYYYQECTKCYAQQNTSIPKLGHNYSAATCTKLATCTRCGVTTGGYSAHSWSSLKVGRAATCTVDGYYYQECTKCYAQQNTPIPKLGHNYSTATCTKLATCTRCGATIGSLAAHSWSSLKVGKNATCTEEGYYYQECTKCYAQQNTPIPKLGHNYSTATCTKLATCTRCNATIGSLAAHSWSSLKVGKNATCTEEGYYYQECTKCYAQQNTPIPKLEHNYSAATCTKPATCTKCGAITGGYATHSWSSQKVGRAATCTVEGYYYQECTKCYTQQNTPIPKLEHKFGEDGFCSCGLSQNGADATLSVSKPSVTIGSASGSSGNFNILSNTSWSISGKPTWLILTLTSATGDAAIGITTANANTYSTSRSAILTVSGGGISRTVMVTQNGADATLSVTTNMPTNITATGATLNGEITKNGGYPITYHGFLWGTSAKNLSNPVELGSRTGDGYGTFSKELKNLQPGTIYYYQAYAANSAEVLTYGYVSTFATPPAPPTINELTPTSYSVNVKWEKVTGAELYQLSWDTNDKFTSASTDIIGDRSEFEVTELKSNATYYFRIRAYGFGKWSEYSAGVKSVATVREGIVTKITIPEKIEITIPRESNNVEINATVVPANATYNLVWDSTNEPVVTCEKYLVDLPPNPIDPSRVKIRAHKAGEAVITVSCKNIDGQVVTSNECTVTVKPIQSSDFVTIGDNSNQQYIFRGAMIDGDTATVHVNSRNWNAFADKSWVKIKKNETDSGFVIGLESNISYRRSDDDSFILSTTDTRSAYITITGTEYSGGHTMTRVIPIVQRGVKTSDEKIEIYDKDGYRIHSETFPANFVITHAKDTFEAAQSSVVHYLYYFSAGLSSSALLTVLSSPDWALILTGIANGGPTQKGYTKSDGTCDIIVDPNPGAQRTGKIMILGDDYESALRGDVWFEEISIKQKGLLVDAPAEGTFAVINVAHDAIDYEESWFHVVGNTQLIPSLVPMATDSPNDNSFITVTVDPNFSEQKRTGAITVTNGDDTTTIYVNQDGANTILEASKTIVLLSASEDEEKVNIDSNVSWEAYCDADWVDLYPASGFGPSELTITAYENISTSPRTATISISGGEISETITISQTVGATLLTVDPASITDISSLGEIHTITVNSNRSWLVTSTAPWVTLIQNEGIGSGSFSIKFAENSTSSSRSGIVTIKTASGDKTQNILVSQEKGSPIIPALTVSPTTITNVSPYGGSTSITVTSNTSWSSSTTASWIILSPDTGSGNGNGSFSIEIAPNTTTSSRTGIVTVKTTSGSGDETRSILVGQDKGGAPLIPILTLSHISITNVADSGESFPIIVVSNTTWAVTAKPDWVAISVDSDGAFTIIVEPNNNSNTRSGLITVKTTYGSGDKTSSIMVSQQKKTATF